MTRRVNNYCINIPDMYTGESSRTGIKTGKLVHIKKAIEENISIQYEWSQPAFRNGVNGSKLISKNKILMLRKKNRKKGNEESG